jgi:4-hydroxy-2-oxoglutarate aldolase
MKKLQPKGVIPPVITPFNADGEVNYGAYERNMERWEKENLGGYVVLGSNGEFPYLGEDEKLELVKLTVEGSKKGRPVLVGTGMESARETIRLTNKAAKLGADAALILTPNYFSSIMDETKSFIAFFKEVADHSDIPVYLYNVPKFSKVNMKVEAVAALATHPNIHGMKDSTGDAVQLQNFKSAVPAEWNLMTGTAITWLEALKMGIKACIIAPANCYPQAAVDVMNAFDAGNVALAEELNVKSLALNKISSTAYGMPGLKVACDMLGYEGGHVRNPLLDLSPEEAAKFKVEFADFMAKNFGKTL